MDTWLLSDGARVVAFAGGERGSRVSQDVLNIHRGRVRGSEHRWRRQDLVYFDEL